jgi:hypothetical protein
MNERGVALYSCTPQSNSVSTSNLPPPKQMEITNMTYYCTCMLLYGTLCGGNISVPAGNKLVR